MCQRFQSAGAWASWAYTWRGVVPPASTSAKRPRLPMQAWASARMVCVSWVASASLSGKTRHTASARLFIAPAVILVVEQAVGLFRTPGSGGIGVDEFLVLGPLLEDGVDHAPSPFHFVKAQEQERSPSITSSNRVS